MDKPEPQRRANWERWRGREGGVALKTSERPHFSNNVMRSSPVANRTQLTALGLMVWPIEGWKYKWQVWEIDREREREFEREGDIAAETSERPHFSNNITRSSQGPLLLTAPSLQHLSCGLARAGTFEASQRLSVLSFNARLFFRKHLAWLVRVAS